MDLLINIYIIFISLFLALTITRPNLKILYCSYFLTPIIILLWFLNSLFFNNSFDNLLVSFISLIFVSMTSILYDSSYRFEYKLDTMEKQIENLKKETYDLEKHIQNMKKILLER